MNAVAITGDTFRLSQGKNPNAEQQSFLDALNQILNEVRQANADSLDTLGHAFKSPIDITSLCGRISQYNCNSKLMIVLPGNSKATDLTFPNGANCTKVEVNRIKAEKIGNSWSITLEVFTEHNLDEAKRLGKTPDRQIPNNQTKYSGAVVLELDSNRTSIAMTNHWDQHQYFFRQIETAILQIVEAETISHERHPTQFRVGTYNPSISPTSQYTRRVTDKRASDSLRIPSEIKRKSEVFNQEEISLPGIKGSHAIVCSSIYSIKSSKGTCFAIELSEILATSGEPEDRSRKPKRCVWLYNPAEKSLEPYDYKFKLYHMPLLERLASAWGSPNGGVKIDLDLTQAVGGTPKHPRVYISQFNLLRADPYVYGSGPKSPLTLNHIQVFKPQDAVTGGELSAQGLALITGESIKVVGDKTRTRACAFVCDYDSLNIRGLTAYQYATVKLIIEAFGLKDMFVAASAGDIGRSDFTRELIINTGSRGNLEHIISSVGKAIKEASLFQALFGYLKETEDIRGRFVVRGKGRESEKFEDEGSSVPRTGLSVERNLDDTIFAVQLNFTADGNLEIRGRRQREAGASAALGDGSAKQVRSPRTPKPVVKLRVRKGAVKSSMPASSSGGAPQSAEKDFSVHHTKFATLIEQLSGSGESLDISGTVQFLQTYSEIITQDSNCVIPSEELMQAVFTKIIFLNGGKIGKQGKQSLIIAEEKDGVLTLQSRYGRSLRQVNDFSHLANLAQGFIDAITADDPNIQLIICLAAWGMKYKNEWSRRKRAEDMDQIAAIVGTDVIGNDDLVEAESEAEPETDLVPASGVASEPKQQDIQFNTKSREEIYTGLNQLLLAAPDSKLSDIVLYFEHYTNRVAKEKAGEIPSINYFIILYSRLIYHYQKELPQFANRIRFKTKTKITATNPVHPLKGRIDLFSDMAEELGKCGEKNNMEKKLLELADVWVRLDIKNPQLRRESDSKGTPHRELLKTLIKRPAL